MISIPKKPLVAGISAWMLSVGAMQANAACPAALNDFDIIDCVGADVDGFDDGGFSWLTINVANGASIINPALDAITLNGSGIYTINNLGTIGDNVTIIGIDMSGTDALVVNNLGNGLIQALDNGISVVGTGDVKIINGANATITGDLDLNNTGVAIRIDLVNKAEIENLGIITLDSDDGTIFLNDVNQVLINNSGLIQNIGTGQAIEAEDVEILSIINSFNILAAANTAISVNLGGALSIQFNLNNSGVIDGNGMGSLGVHVVNTNTVNIVNFGTIEGEAQAIFIDNPLFSTIVNTGIIQSNTSDAITIVSNGAGQISINNANLISGAFSGIHITNSLNTLEIINSGTVESTVNFAAINIEGAFNLASIVNLDGNITGFTDGIQAITGGNTLNIFNVKGTIEGQANGINLDDIDTVTINNSDIINGDIDNNDLGNGILANAIGGSLTVINNANAAITTQSDNLNEAAINVTNSNSFGLANAGVIVSQTNGVLVADTATVNILNSGTITADVDGVGFNDAINVLNANLTVINNTATGLIEALGLTSSTDAIFVSNDNGFLGDIFLLNNAGNIEASLAQNLLGDGVDVENISLVGIVNSGNILGSDDGIEILQAEQVVINNTGVIQGSNSQSGSGITVDGTSLLADNFSLLNGGDIFGHHGVNAINVFIVNIENTLSGEIGDLNTDTAIFVLDDGQDGFQLDQFHLINAGSIIANRNAVESVDINTVEIGNSGIIVGLQNGITVTNALATEIENTLTGEIGGLNGAIGVFDNNAVVGDTLAIKNDGLILSQNVGILSFQVDDVGIQNTGDIIGSAAAFFATVIIQDALSTVIVNGGTGLIQGINDLGFERAIVVFDQNVNVPGDTFTLFNQGIVEAAGTAVTSAFIETVQIQNDGTIEGDTEQGAVNGGAGILVVGALTTTIINTGTILSNDINAQLGHAIIVRDSAVLQGDTLFISNVGDIKGNHNGITSQGVDTVTILNNKLIAGNADGDAVNGGTGIEIFDAITTLIQNGLAGNIQAGIYVTDVNADQAADTLTIVNDGKIEGKNVPQPLARNGINVVDIETIWIENHGTGEISGFDTAIDITNALDTTILNSFGGLISGEIFGITAIDLIASPNDKITIKNDGTINTFDGNAFAAIDIINIAEVLIDNTGLIESVGYGIEIIAPQTVEINNTGTIQSLNGFVAFDAIRVLGDILVLDESVTVNNDGLVQAINAGGDAVTVADVGDFTFNNGSSGEVIADGFGFDIFNVTTAVINNHGLIESQSANIAINSVNSQDTVNLFETSTTIGDINLNELDDVVNIYAGAVVDGHIDASTNANNDFDVINFDKVNVDNGAFNLDDAEHFEEAHLIDGYWTMTGTGATHFDLFSVEGGTLAIGGPNDYNDLIIDTDLYKQEMPGTLRIKLDASTSGVNDHLFITGVADLGGTLSLDLDLQKTLDLKPGETREYTILTADGGVNSVFDEELPTDFQYKSLVLTRDVIYEPNDVIVFIGRLAYEDVEGLEYFDNISEARYLTTILENNLYSGDIEALLNNLDTIDNLDQFRDALEAVDGQAYFAFSKMAVDAAESTTRALSDGLNKRNPDTIDEDYKVAMFLQPVYGTSTRDSFEEHTEFDSRGWGVVGGVGYLVTNNVEVGVVGAYYDMESEANLRNGNRSGDADGDIYSVRGYVKLDNLVDGNLYVIGSLGYAWGDYDMDRTVAIRPTAEEAGILREFEGSTDSSTIEASIEAGYRVKAGIVNITPYVSTNYAYIQVDDFTESDKGLTNSNLALHVDPDEIQHLSTEAGVNVDARIEMGTMTLVPSFNVNAERVWSDLEHDSNNGFASLGGLDTPIESNDAGRNTVGARLGLDLEINKTVSFGIAGDLRQGDDTDFWGFSGNVKAKF